MKKTIEKIRHAPAKIRIGKKGVTEGIIMEVESLLKKEQAVKIKCLDVIPSSMIKNIASNISNLTNSMIIEIRGKTFILYRSNRRM
ncbi:MAG: YhbY family RNA-binding protein [Candidatus Heimdallarchaeaceae archaeon]